MNDWVRHAIWWQVYPLGFTGAERTALPEGADPVPRLRQLEAWLPHLVELGCNGLALGPVFASETHGYDTVDHLRVDPRLGSEADLQRAAGRLRRPRGPRAVRRRLQPRRPRAPALPRAPRAGPRLPGRPLVPRATRPAAPRRLPYRDFEGHSALVALDHDSPGGRRRWSPR